MMMMMMTIAFKKQERRANEKESDECNFIVDYRIEQNSWIAKSVLGNSEIHGKFLINYPHGKMCVYVRYVKWKDYVYGSIFLCMQCDATSVDYKHKIT